MKLVVRPAAAGDLEEAYLWYESQRLGLGEEFLAAVREVFEAVEKNPERYQVIYRESRRTFLRRFPYGVFYRIMAEEIVVVACLHACAPRPTTLAISNVMLNPPFHLPRHRLN